MLRAQRDDANAVAEWSSSLPEGARAQLAAIVESSDDAILSKTLGGVIASWNAAAERMYGYSADEAIGQRVTMLLPPDRLHEVDKILEGLRKGEHIRNFETVRMRKDGRLVDVSLTISPLRDDRGQIVGASTIARDITDLRRAAEERTRLEAELRQSQKLEALGRLAGGMAHDFNNLLTVISGFSRLLHNSLDEADPLASYVGEIETAAERGAALVQQILAFSRRQLLKPELLDLNRLIAETEPMIRRLVGENVELVTSLSSPLRSVRADPGQITQVILNLAANSRDAMPEGGTLRVETANVDVSNHPGESAPVLPGRFVLLSITDTGVGMDEPTKNQAFEPFFTTKPLGAGTGLGLSTVHGIVEQSGGGMELETAPDRGTTVRIFLPQVATAQEHLPAREIEHTRGTILLAEDDPSVRSLVRLVLGEAGFRVLEAESGKEALELATSYEGALDLLMTDLIMPGMNGIELAEQLVHERIGVAVLYVTGYADEELAARGQLEELDTVLRKPFAPDALVAKVEHLLSERRARL
jgi:two-component system cell cycle sensor histidine kinase/response regulator CckA